MWHYIAQNARHALDRLIVGPKGSCINLYKCEGVTHIISGMKERIIYVYGTRQEMCDLYGTLCDKKKKKNYFLFSVEALKLLGLLMLC